MNILTTNGLVGRYMTDWSGPGGILGTSRSDWARRTTPTTR